MKQVININFQGRVVPIEVTAFELLKNYTESLARYFAHEEGKEEIINDIESRIGELFQDRIAKGATCITDNDVEAIIDSMGRPEDFEASEDNQNQAAQNAQEKSEQKSHTSGGPKKLYRDEDNKVLGGVCSGLANYFGVDIMVIRILFIILIFAFGVGLIPYIILWIAIPSNADNVIGGTRKKLYRDSDDKIIAGVCSGIGNYFGISAWIPRLLFVLPFLSFVFRWGRWGDMNFPDFLRIGFSPGALIVYIILWLVLPEANTTAEKLEMKGEKVDIGSIKNSVVEEMKGLKHRTEKFGKEAAAYAQEKAKKMGTEMGTAGRRSGGSLGDIIALLFKIFAYFIVGCIVFGLFMGLIGMGIVSIGLFPLKDFLITSGWQNAYAWGTLVFFIAVPIVGILTWLIRRITKVKGNRKLIRMSFAGMWTLGWVCLVMLVASLSKDFRRSSENLAEEEIFLSNPKVNQLTITSQTPIEKYIRHRWLNFEPFNGIYDDTGYVRNIDVHIIKSSGDSFKVTMIKMANGRTKMLAQGLADRIQYGGIQSDSILLMDKGIAINKVDKFRNQRIILLVYVPVGKQIKIDESIGWFNQVHFNTPFNDGDDYIDFNNEEHDWRENMDYIMRKDGLYTLDGIPAKEDRKRRRHVRIGKNGVQIRDGNKKIYIDQNGTNVIEDEDDKAERILDSIHDKQEREKDSLEEKQKKEIEKALNANQSPSALSIPIGYAGMSTII